MHSCRRRCSGSVNRDFPSRNKCVQRRLVVRATRDADRHKRGAIEVSSRDRGMWISYSPMARGSRASIMCLIEFAPCSARAAAKRRLVRNSSTGRKDEPIISFDPIRVPQRFGPGPGHIETSLALRSTLGVNWTDIGVAFTSRFALPLERHEILMVYWATLRHLDKRRTSTVRGAQTQDPHAGRRRKCPKPGRPVQEVLTSARSRRGPMASSRPQDGSPRPGNPVRFPSA